ncbi:hypothetical protein EVAR_90587_1 [Eumeta japonica]|uniref:Uncharacterized protein n=1 Tax=Eumeta variegata TaxID=151549 RepID=A0A4C1ZXS8_EUMVA|nr:hypothetical protein EVAR_90587_1 [Eumeta japonica]
MHTWLNHRGCNRYPRHHALDDIIRWALISANVPCTFEPPGFSRSDGKRPGGLTLIPWQIVRNLIWDVTCANTFSASHLNNTLTAAASGAESAAKQKTSESILKDTYLFIPIVCETSGPWDSEAKRVGWETQRQRRVPQLSVLSVPSKAYLLPSNVTMLQTSPRLDQARPGGGIFVTYSFLGLSEGDYNLRVRLDNSELSWSTMQEIVPRNEIARIRRPQSRVTPQLLAAPQRRLRIFIRV